MRRWSHGAYAGGTFDYAPGRLGVEKGGRIGQTGSKTADRLVGKPKGGELAFWHWRSSYPIIVGRQALIGSINSGEFPPDSLPQRLWNLLPFQGMQYAAGILQTQIEGCLVECFILAVPEIDREGNIVGFDAGETEFIVRGRYLERPEIARFISNARGWWSQFNGTRIARGRPRGTTKTSTRELVDRFRELTRFNRGRKPTQAEFLESVQIHPDTLRSTLSSSGHWPWERFVELCNSARTLKR